MRATNLLVLMFTLLLGACGFHLRGQGAFALPFKTLYVQSSNSNTPFVVELKRAIQANGAQLAKSPDQAQLTLHIVSELTDKQILSLSGGGRVREYRLLYRVSLRAYDQKQQDWIASEEIALQRDFYYDDVQILAKEHEEALLYQNMRSDAVQQVLRRLNHAKPPQQTEP
ncbi:MAG: LPS assembly lipoprotein LptE [Gallionellaceae bacterium]|nr:LPS assembly lipoprotein LptE [Gallionellaceae bacterium]